MRDYRTQSEKMKVMIAISVWQYVKISEVSIGTSPRDSLVADEDVKKLIKHKVLELYL